MISIADPSQPVASANKQLLDAIPSSKILLNEIDPSPYQRRTDFNDGQLIELGDSLLQHGQINDILVREKNGRYELLTGERRTRAARMIGWEDIRAKVLVLDDSHAAELVLIEQLQTQPWNMLEESQGYRMLLDLVDADGKKMHTYDSIAKRIGKSMYHVRELVALLEVPEEVQRAVVDGKLAKRAAFALNIIPLPAERAKAAKMALKPIDKDRPLTAVETVSMIQEHFARRLKKGSWDQDKEDILSEEKRAELGFTVGQGKCKHDGSCLRCEFRSGNHPDLTDQLQTGAGKGETTEGISPDLCLNTPCHLLKSKAVEQAVLDKLMKRGSKAIIDDDAKNIFDRDGSVRSNSDYVALEDKPDSTLCGHYNNEKIETWRALLKAHAKHQVQVYVARRPNTAEYVELVLMQDAIKSINEGMKEFGDAPIFTHEQAVAAEKAASDGPNIIVDKPKDTAFDSTADKENKSENRKLVADKNKQAVAMLQMFHRNLRYGLKADPDDARAHEMFLNQMDQRLVNPDALAMLRKVFGVGADEEWTDGALPEGGVYDASDFFAATVTAFAAVCVVHWGLDGWKGLPDWQLLLGMGANVDEQPNPSDDPESPPGPVVDASESETMPDAKVNCPTCGNPVDSIFDHVDGCPEYNASNPAPTDEGESAAPWYTSEGVNVQEMQEAASAEVIAETAASPAPAAKKTAAKKAVKKASKKVAKKAKGKPAAPPKAKIAKIKKGLQASYDSYKAKRRGR